MRSEYPAAAAMPISDYGEGLVRSAGGAVHNDVDSRVHLGLMYLIGRSTPNASGEQQVRLGRTGSCVGDG